MFSPRQHVLPACLAAAALVLVAGPAPAQDLQQGTTRDGTELQLGSQQSFHTTNRTVTDLRLVEVPSSEVFAVTWTESSKRGESDDFYAISLDGSTIQAVKKTDYVVKMKRGDFDPFDGAPNFAESSLPPTDNLYIVQFVTQPLQAYREAIGDVGGKTLAFIANHSHIVRMDRETRRQVQALPFVRWIGEYHSEYRTETFLIDGLSNGTLPDGFAWYNLQFFERGPDAKGELAEFLTASGADVSVVDGSSFMNVAMTPNMLLDVLGRDEILFVDRYFPSTETDMNVARNLSGANYLETQAGITGQGVRAEVADGNLRTTHQEFSPAPLIHGPTSGSASHGTPVTSCVFADGVSSNARGVLPDGQIIFADSGFGWTGSSGGASKPGGRWGHTRDLVDPALQWKGVFQTNSTGSPRTFFYTVVSAQMDEIVFDHDVVICQSQSNAGNQDSRPQAWGKNMMGIGGIRHQNTLTTSDDSWSFGGSIGPASDGRIKPDLAHFYDNVFAATSSSNSAYTQFSGTSSATPVTAGHFGLFFQMWDQGMFGNTPSGTTVFGSKSHFSTAKAMLINTASQWNFSGANHDLTRVHQGWGRADVQRMYDLRNKMLIVDEEEVLTNLQSKTYNVQVNSGEPALKATLVYADMQGTTSSSQHRINDLTLKVTSPSGTTYWGNNGLLANMWSTPGGEGNNKDTVENVFVQNPQAGTWTVEVIASEVNVDTHIETPQIDADYGLVVSGVVAAPCPPANVVVNNGTGFNPVCFSSLNSPVLGSTWNLQVDATGFANVQWSAVWCRVGTGGSFFFDPGEVLVGLQNPVCFNSFVAGSGVMNHSHDIANNPALAGQNWVVQGLFGSADKFGKFCNALDVTVGCSP